MYYSESPSDYQNKGRCLPKPLHSCNQLLYWQKSPANIRLRIGTPKEVVSLNKHSFLVLKIKRILGWVVSASTLYVSKCKSVLSTGASYRGGVGRVCCCTGGLSWAQAMSWCWPDARDAKFPVSACHSAACASTRRASRRYCCTHPGYVLWSSQGTVKRQNLNKLYLPVAIILLLIIKYILF